VTSMPTTILGWIFGKVLPWVCCPNGNLHRWKNIKLSQRELNKITEIAGTMPPHAHHAVLMLDRGSYWECDKCERITIDPPFLSIVRSK